jgi:lysophospholipase L1-like esterase
MLCLNTRSLLAALLVSLLPVAAAAQSTPVRICPLGDSITESFYGQPTYRYYLDHALHARGCDFDFVGTCTGVVGVTPRFPDFDQDHEGHSGWTVDMVLGELGAWVATTRPDVFLVHLGTNDLLGRQSVESTVAELEQCIDVIRGLQPHATVVLAKIIPTPLRDTIAPFNAQVAQLAARKDAPDARVVVADLNTGFQPRFLLRDQIHPSDEGEEWMAARWLDALVPFLVPASTPYRSYAAGCGPVLRRVMGQAPALGQAFTVVVESGSTSSGAMWGMFGFERASWLGMPLPARLDHLGMWGCVLALDPDVVVELGAGRSRAWTVEIPAVPQLAGLPFYQQAAVVDPLANAFGMTLSNANEGRVLGG